jgi:hypothetical protein
MPPKLNIKLICGTCWIKFLEHTIVIVVVEIDNIALLDYSKSDIQVNVPIIGLAN